jgi:hypothetical protein
MSTSKQSLHENYQKQFFELKTTKTVQTLLRRELENQTAHGQDTSTGTVPCRQRLLVVHGKRT